MSEMVFEHGELTRVGDIGQWSLNVMGKISDRHDVGEYLYENNLHKTHFILNDGIWVGEVTEENPYGFSNVKVDNDTNTIKFTCFYYNGGGSLEEVLERELNKGE